MGDSWAVKNAESVQRQRATRQSRNASREMKDKMNTALRNATSTKERREIKEEFRVDTNKASDQTDNQQGVNEDSNQRGDDVFKPTYDTLGNDSRGGGSGLPEFPGDAPGIEVKAPLVWDGDEDEARWLKGTTQSVSDPKSYVDVFGYDPTPSSDNFSLYRTEFLEVIMCKDGEPVTGNIFFVEADPQP